MPSSSLVCRVPWCMQQQASAFADASRVSWWSRRSETMRGWLQLSKNRLAQPALDTAFCWPLRIPSASEVRAWSASTWYCPRNRHPGCSNRNSMSGSPFSGSVMCSLRAGVMPGARLQSGTLRDRRRPRDAFRQRNPSRLWPSAQNAVLDSEYPSSPTADRRFSEPLLTRQTSVLYQTFFEMRVMTSIRKPSMPRSIHQFIIL